MLGVQVPFFYFMGRKIEEEDEEIIDLDDLLSDSDLLSSMMEELKEFSPGAGEALIDERDRYIAEKIIESQQAKYCIRSVQQEPFNNVAEI